MNKKLSSLVKRLNAVSVVAALWTFFFPVPYRLVIALCALLFTAAMTAFIYSRGLIAIDEPRNSKTAHVSYAALFPALALAARGFFDFHFVQAGDLLVPVGSLFLSVCFLLWLLTRHFKVKPRTYMTAVPLVFAFCFGMVAELNGLLSFDEPEVYRARVISKTVADSSDGPTLYYLMVTGWLNREDNNKLVVTKRIHERYNLNDDARIAVRQGALGVPFYYVLNK